MATNGTSFITINFVGKTHRLEGTDRYMVYRHNGDKTRTPLSGKVTFAEANRIKQVYDIKRSEQDVYGPKG